MLRRLTALWSKMCPMSQKILSALLFVLASLALSACQQPADENNPDEHIHAQGHSHEAPRFRAFQSPDRSKLGLMTSLPLYWSLEAELEDFAQGIGSVPWQRTLLERQFELVPLDTLSPIPALSPGSPDLDPLAGLERIAVIQPRGLSPADNVALDEWVKAGGQLLLVLDPELTGHYEAALGDPRRPVDTALVPPVVARWGLVGAFDAEQDAEVSYAQLPGGAVPLLMSGETQANDAAGGTDGCVTHESRALVHCDNVGKGTVTYLHDAAVFEHPELVGEEGEAVRALLDFAFR